MTSELLRADVVGYSLQQNPQDLNIFPAGRTDLFIVFGVFVELAMYAEGYVTEGIFGHDTIMFLKIDPVGFDSGGAAAPPRAPPRDDLSAIGI